MTPDYVRVRPDWAIEHQQVARAYRDPAAWTRTSIFKTARMGIFSSDRTVRQYAEEIWEVAPVSVPGAATWERRAASLLGT